MENKFLKLMRLSDFKGSSTNDLLQQSIENINDPMMMGETFLQMYQRLKKEQGGEPFMPQYAYDSLNKNIAGKEKYLKFRSAFESDEGFPSKLKDLKKELEKLYGLRGS